MPSMRTFLKRLRRAGASGVLRGVMRRIRPVRADAMTAVQAAVGGRQGLEIGGPSGLFAGHGALALYHVLAGLDNCNFSRYTLWEGEIEDGQTFEYRRGVTGRQYIREATDLSGISAEAYGCLLSSHTLEHVANPLLALREWKRVLQPGGTLVLILPHRDATFDHLRSVTELQHLLDDEARDVGEDDTTHVAEVLALHDLSRDPAAGSKEQFRERCMDNLRVRGMHQHVFDTALAVRMVDAAGFRIDEVEAFEPHHILVVATKPAYGEALDNAAFTGGEARWRRVSPFATDRSGNGN